MSAADPPPPGAAPLAPGDPPRGPPRWRRRLAVALLVSLALAAGWAAAVEPRRLEVTRHDLSAGAPDPLRLVHLTDLHVDSLSAGYAARVLASVQALEPDLIVITGDTVTAPLQADEVQAARALLDRLSAPLGVWACLGNHEAWSGPEALEAFEEVTLLRGRSAALPGTNLVLHGVDDWEAPLPASGPGFDLLLCHYPAVLPRAAEAGHELVLAGHSHGGQVRIPLLGPLWLPPGCDEFEQGWYASGATRMYVSRGVGTSVVPLRFACRPELALILLPRPGGAPAPPR